MLSYCLNCRKNTESKNPKVVKTKNRRAMLLSTFSACNSKKSKFLKAQEAKGLLSKLTEMKLPILSDLPILNVFLKYKRNAIINKFLLAEDRFMPEMHLKQSAFTNSACDPFTQNIERIQKVKETGDSIYIYQNELDKSCFQHDMTYGDFKDLNRRTTADNVLGGKAFNIAKNTKYDGYQRGLASMVR